MSKDKKEAQNARQRASRAKKRAKGREYLELWPKSHHKPLIRKYAKELEDSDDETNIRG